MLLLPRNEKCILLNSGAFKMAKLIMMIENEEWIYWEFKEA
tara:strand:+ start:49 stop:171 length:123 start_codon:yes stop_codon:yes gene_type:complete